MRRTISHPGGIHPEYYEIIIVATNGTEFKSGSTKNAGHMRATFDKYNHAAWNKGAARQVKTGMVAKFNARHDGFSISSLFGAIDEDEESEGERNVANDASSGDDVAGSAVSAEQGGKKPAPPKKKKK